MASSIGLAVILSIHLFVHRLRFLDAVPRSRWLSFAGGVAVSYVFLHVLPELAATFRSHAEEGPTFEFAPYLLALAGLAAFYGLERHLQTSRRRREHQEHRRDALFWTHVGSFALYNAILALLLVQREPSLLPLILYILAISLHVLAIDYGLWKTHHALYQSRARWILVLSGLIGYLVARAQLLGPLVVDGLFAFLAGAVVLNALKEELPQDRESRFLPFLLGVIVLAVLFMATDWLPASV